MNPITTVLLDLDGTLLDSNDAHAKAWVIALREFEIQREVQEVRNLIGMGADQLLPKLIGVNSADPVIEKISKRRGEIFREQFLKSLRPFAGARALVMKLIETGRIPVVATSASQADLDGLLSQIQIKDLIQLKTSSDDADRSKPCPDILVQALRKAKARPDEAVMIGDTPYDIEAATKAGVRSIAFTCGGWSTEELRNANEIYKGPDDLLAGFNDSILGPRTAGR